MNPQTLTLWANGAVTLPKEWREQYPTSLFLVEETADGNLLIKPILDSVYYEEKDGSFGVRFPTGMEAGELLKRMKKARGKVPSPRGRG